MKERGLLGLITNHENGDNVNNTDIEKQVMEALNWVNCGLMSFVPTLERNSTGSRQAQRFQAKVRYKAEGLDATKRYRHKVTRTQSRERLLLRPFQAAKGILPVVSTRRQQQ